MPAKIFALMVLTTLELLYAVKFVVLECIIAKNKDEKKVKKAKYNKEVSMWLFTIFILIKFVLETSMMESIPVFMWTVDMLLANFCTMNLVSKYILNKKADRKR